MKPSLFLIALLASAAGGRAFAEAPAAAQKGGCLACHSMDKKVVGPAFKDVAAKYKGQGDAVVKLSEKVRKGSTGVWGPIPMPPSSAEKINDADLKATLEWILKG